jgi:hypothetical protein
MKGYILVKNGIPVEYSGCYYAIFTENDYARQENELQKDTEVREVIITIN